MTPKELAEFALAMAQESFKPLIGELENELTELMLESGRLHQQLRDEMSIELQAIRVRCDELEALNNEAARRAMAAGTLEDISHENQ